MKISIIAIICAVNIAYAQQRLSIDATYRKTTVNTTLGIHKVINNNWLISLGLTYGGKGRYSFHHLDYSHPQQAFSSSYRDLRVPQESSSFELKRYDVNKKVAAMQLGIGYFYNLDVKHGFRGHFNLISGIANNEISAYFVSVQDQEITKTYSTINHWFLATNAEVYHTIRVWRKITFFYGFKIPYYFSVDKANFHPNRSEEGMYQFEPELGLGLTFQIGDC